MQVMLNRLELDAKGRGSHEAREAAAEHIKTASACIAAHQKVKLRCVLDRYEVSLDLVDLLIAEHALLEQNGRKDEALGKTALERVNLNAL